MSKAVWGAAAAGAVGLGALLWYLSTRPKSTTQCPSGDVAAPCPAGYSPDPSATGCCVQNPPCGAPGGQSWSTGFCASGTCLADSCLGPGEVAACIYQEEVAGVGYNICGAFAEIQSGSVEGYIAATPSSTGAVPVSYTVSLTNEGVTANEVPWNGSLTKVVFLTNVAENDDIAVFVQYSDGTVVEGPALSFIV